MTSASVAIPQYLDTLRHSRKLSENTLRTYKHALRRFSRIIGEDGDLSEENYKKFLRTIARETNKAQITYRVPVSRLYEYHAPGIPVKLLTEQFGQKKSKRFIQYNEEGVEKLVSYALTLRGDLLALRDRALILSLADTGMRRFEASGLNRSDIDFDRSRAFIIGKGDKPGIIRFSPRSLTAIRDYLSARAELDGKSGLPLGSLPLFARHDRGAGKKVKRLKPGGIERVFRIRTREAGISEEEELERGDVTAHKLRHRFVTKIIRKTGSVSKAKELARHEDINTTSGYSHLSEGEIDETYKEIFGE